MLFCFERVASYILMPHPISNLILKLFYKGFQMRHTWSGQYLGLEIDADEQTILKYILEYVLNCSSQKKSKSMGLSSNKSMIYIRTSLKIQQIIKPMCPRRQLFISITFAFMKIFDFLVKMAFFGAFLFRSSHGLLPKTNDRSQQ